jgi:hypothetical protein
MAEVYFFLYCCLYHQFIGERGVSPVARHNTAAGLFFNSSCYFPGQPEATALRNLYKWLIALKHI